MMENVFFLGLKFENNYADGFIEPPLGFLIHDILHGTMYLNNLIKHSVDKLDLKSFYDYFLMRKGSMDPVTFKKIMFMFFLLVHELYVNFFIQPDGSIPDKGMISHIIRGEYEDKPLSPITNSNFLGLLFPREIREMPNSNPDENTAKSTASWEYIMSAIDEYISLLERWHSSKQTAGRRKRRRTRNKRKGLRRKTRKNK
jgi:hypothetical protein